MRLAYSDVYEMIASCVMMCFTVLPVFSVCGAVCGPVFPVFWRHSFTERPREISFQASLTYRGPAQPIWGGSPPVSKTKRFFSYRVTLLRQQFSPPIPGGSPQVPL